MAACNGAGCPAWSRNGEHPETSAKGALVQGWWVSGYGPAALAEKQVEGARGRVVMAVGFAPQGELTVECSAGPWTALIPWQVLSELRLRAGR